MTFTVWKDPPLPASNVAPIRLVAVADSVAIYCGKVAPAMAGSAAYPFQTTLTPITVSGPQLPDIVVPQHLATSASFDLAAAADGELALAIEDFGGAVNALVIGSIDQGRVVVRATYSDFNDYRFSRFVRGDAAPGRMVTAIANGAALVVMSGAPLAPADVGHKGDPFVKLADATAGLAIATTPPNGHLQGAALLAKSGSAGPPSPAGDFLGTLSLINLATGRATARPGTLFGPGVTYAFDADIRSDLILVLAATNRGPQLLACNSISGQTTPVAWPSGYPPAGTWIAYPTVLAAAGTGKVFHIAFFDFGTDGLKGIRYAQLDLSAVP
ncbi:hypothetical protein FHP25_22145 [Vineibacter terrae]|uniref:Uncharacterized protein n=1 Tax=Vineibacter terrae TaxID=2586908 RepID=A0A5C8PH60_9HYPH|nr:hypothetical protein [Vineibacter terrae]TXL73136.1 hypothetical protein FHP25_22145 [Vineibacter terrae]